MMLWHVYVRKGMVFIPNVARTDAGFYVDIDPVAVVESAIRQSVIDAIKAAVVRGNPRIDSPKRATFPKPVVLSYAKVKSWAAFEQGASCWIISNAESTFQLRPQRTNPSGGWEDEPAKVRIFSGSAALDELANAIADQINVA
jgi:hypothetical protein